MTLALGIRSFISPEGLPELERQASDARKVFPKAKMILAACGEIVPDKIASVFDSVVHYSGKAEGHGRSWSIILDYASKNRCEDVIVTNGNDQHIFPAVRKIYERAPKGVTVPERMKRVIFTRDSIDGLTLEDLENGFLRRKWATSVRDLQAGLFMIKGRGYYEPIGSSIGGLDSWLGDLAFYDLLFSTHPDIRINTPKIEVRSQHFSISSRLFVFRTIASCEKHFRISFQELIREAEKEPFSYLFDGSPSRIGDIETAYMNFRNAEKIHGMKGLILAAGRGTGLKPITDNRLKPLVPVANKPMIMYVLDDLINAGITDIGIVISPAGTPIKEAVGDGSRWKVKVTYIVQPEPLGLAHAVRCAQGFIGGSPFILYLGDNLLSGGIAGFVSAFASSSDDARLMLTTVDDPTRFGVVELDDKRRPIRLVEKPEKPKSNFAIVGIYAFRSSVFDAISKIKPSPRGELEITDAIQALISSSKPVSVEFVKDWWHDTGKPQSLLLANGLMLDHMKDTFNEGGRAPSAKIFGRVRIGRGSSILENTEIRGPVSIGEGCVIGPDCLIGPYTSVADGARISRTSIEFSMVFDKAVIEGAGRITDSIIGSGCTVRGKGAREIIKPLILGDGRSIEV
ncbi:MAG: glucose-1-phosphate thymidylyltransferase [Candidatus Micrarchaeota archaeon]